MILKLAQLKKGTNLFFILICLPFFSFSQFFEMEKEMRSIPDGIYTYTDDTGNIIETGKVKNTKKFGKWFHYYGLKEIREVGRYINGKAVGKHLLFYENGNKKLIAHYKYYFGPSRAKEVIEEDAIIQYTGYKRCGIWKYYTEEGKIIKIERYKKGILVKSQER